MLAESVAERMREAGFLCRTVQINLRDNELAQLRAANEASDANMPGVRTTRRRHAAFALELQLEQTAALHRAPRHRPDTGFNPDTTQHVRGR